MKKILAFVTLFLGIVGLTSCDEKSCEIKYKNSLGEEETLIVSATEDPEVVKSVLEYVSQAEVTETEGFKLLGSAAFEMGYTGGEYSSSTSYKANVSAIANLDKGFKVNADSSLTVKANEIESSIKTSFDIQADDKLDESFASTGTVYAKLSYQSGTEAPQVKKMAYSAATIIGELEDILNSIVLHSQVGSITAIPDTDTVFESILALLEESKLVISSVDGTNIVLTLRIALKDVLKAMGMPDYSISLLKIDENAFYDFNFVIQASTGLIVGFNFTIDDTSIGNIILLMTTISPQDASFDKFKISASFGLEYGAVEFTPLTDAEKALYPAE